MFRWLGGPRKSFPEVVFPNTCLYILKIFKVRMFKCNDRMFIIHISYICLVIWGDPQYYIFYAASCAGIHLACS